MTEVKINYIKCEFIPNKLNTKDSVPLCALYYDLGYGENEWSFGVSKAIKFIQAHDELYEQFKQSNDQKWKHTIDFGGRKPNGKPNVYTLSWVKLEVLHHFLDKVKEYVVTYHKPREAIPEPKIVTNMDYKTGDFVDYLALPCYAKQEFDIGEGLIPKLLTQSQCAYLFDPDSNGVTIRALKQHDEEHKGMPFEITINARDGRAIPIKYSAEEISCLLKYRRVIQNFKDDPTRICDD